MIVEIADYREVGAKPLHEALRAVPLPFAETYRLPPEGARRWAENTFEEAATTEGARALLAVTGNRVIGGLVVRQSSFETDIYGFPMARVPFLFVAWQGDWGRGFSAASALRTALADVLSGWAVRHCSVLVRADETPSVHAFGEAGWRLVDSTLEFAWECGRTRAEARSADLILREVVPGDHDVLAALARRSYTHTIRSRYTADPELPVERTGELYVEWFERACAGAFGDVVVVAEHQGRPVGFNTFKLDRPLTEATGQGFAAHGIAAVSPDSRGLGLQPAMLHWLAEWHGERGGRFSYGRVLVNNYAMQRACLRSGGFIAQAYHTYHGWSDAWGST